MAVVIETTLGDLTVDLFMDERPIACLNFIKLCQLKYYNFNLFHTVQQGFIAQTGDPSGAGDGGSSVWGVVEGSQKRFFEAEYIPKIHHSSAGMLSLVSVGKNLVGSQFFFTLGENLTSLDGTHCVIGEVVEGHELLRKLNDAIVDESFRPYQDIRITHTVVLEDPFPNPRGFQIPARSPSPSVERLQNGRIAADEDIDDTNGKTMEEMQEMLAEREAIARATILEIVGDLPDADMAPPENVLFVCKLNPVTTDDDLEIIFSRFGVVKGCEVIRDRKTGDSLQYAFVEFEDQKSCEAAYFKMDNVLIDDRRIHVDFSQSVARVTWRGKGRGVIGADGKLDFNNLRDNGANNNGRKNESRTNKRGRNEGRRDVRKPEEQRSRMGSAERRRARELRHQEQEGREDRSRNHNRQRSKSREPTERHRERSDRRRSRSRDRNERRRATSPYRGNRYSPERRRQEDRHNRSSRDRQQRSAFRVQENSQSERRNIERKSKEERSENTQNDRKRLAVERESKFKKKSKRAKSSSTESSDSSDDTESSSDSSEDSSSSTSSDERSKRKKSSKSKHKKTKTKSKHKSKKKHKK
ncbi:peptidyl-prolyl cis-trans isomerase sig-7 [Drosophila grimshawi]|uniref:Peptidyl-prolyl cis-trans isomerase n=1 Tax=Drosophila grimshawi TaxID=7222 RepID=B4JIL1_DROGR|nr:peptidyl-prolyl cis-trans isomerase sig-7 [Drosophila grimshawi]EDV93092.1 GH18460 [Drosophila grimshawi]